MLFRTLSIVCVFLQTISAKPPQLQSKPMKFTKDLQELKEEKELPPSYYVKDDVIMVPNNKWNKSSCGAYPYVTKINWEDCEPAEAENNMCYGRCNSIFIPGVQEQYSTACLPIYKKIDILMNCKIGGKRFQKLRFYWKIVSCSCRKVKLDVDLLEKKKQNRR